MKVATRTLIAIGTLTLGGATAVALASAARADEPVPYPTGESLLEHYHCQACHQPYESGKGPSLHAIAQKYASDPHAREDVANSVLNGSVGAWGPTPMSGIAVSPTDLAVLVDFILAYGQSPANQLNPRLSQ